MNDHDMIPLVHKGEAIVPKDLVKVINNSSATITSSRGRDVEPDPGVRQGRNSHHNPQRDRDIVWALVLAVVPWISGALILWVVLTAVQGA
jgi:uncharacterized membrane protein YbhN (UPF0104 family)